MSVPTPDLPKPSKIGERTQGWDFNVHRLLCGGARSDATFPAWSEIAAHGEGVYGDGPRSASQGGRPLYSTRELALAALRAAALDRVENALAKLGAP